MTYRAKLLACNDVQCRLHDEGYGGFSLRPNMGAMPNINDIENLKLPYQSKTNSNFFLPLRNPISKWNYGWSTYPR